MSPVVLGLFFLSCGWKFYKDYKCTRYLALKNSGHPQYFGGALCAVFIFVMCICLDHWASGWGFYQLAVDKLLAELPLLVSEKESASGLMKCTRAAIWAFPVVVGLTRILNLPLHRSPSLLLAIAKKTRIIDELEETLYYCLERGLMVSLTMKSKKVYVGIPKRHSPDPDRDRVWLSIWPVASGYRDETGCLIFNTFYPDFDLLAAETRGGRTRNDFQLVVPLTEVASAQSFDMASFNRFSSESDVLTKSAQKLTSDMDIVDSLGESSGEGAMSKRLTSNVGLITSEVPVDNTAKVISSEIVNERDKYYLRVYSYFVYSLTASIVMLSYEPWMGALLIAVSGLAATEAIEPIAQRLESMKKAGDADDLSGSMNTKVFTDIH